MLSSPRGGGLASAATWLGWGLIGGVLGYAASWISLALLGVFAWGPNWQQLNALGFMFHDVSYTYTFFFIPPIFAFSFLITTLTSVWVLRQSRSSHLRAFSIGLNLLPGLMSIALTREYPGLEIALLTVGIGWGSFLHWAVLRRRQQHHLAQGQ
ncbi:hypothetical protein HUU61_18140 [Rhodopseudomonas palustris]|nr:hypothetical protein [Rhodopseudomonas palustris]